MNWEQIQSNWIQFKSIIKHDWDKLTDAQLDEVAGRREYLIRKIQLMYGLSKVEIEAQLSDWQKSQINIDGHFYQIKSDLPNVSAR